MFPEIELRKTFEAPEEVKPTVFPSEYIRPAPRVEAVAVAPKPAEFPPSPPKEVYARTPAGEPLITSEDIERWKTTGKKIGDLFERVKHFLETREERHAEREIGELEKEIEKYKLLGEKAKRAETLEAERKKLHEQLTALKMAKLKETV
jgi:hypothetical protein